jgi:hypothetical protein
MRVPQRKLLAAMPRRGACRRGIYDNMKTAVETVWLCRALKHRAPISSVAVTSSAFMVVHSFQAMM